VLCHRGATLNLSGSDLASVLCNLVYEKNVDLLQSYLDAGADASAADYDKRAPLHIAAAEGDAVLVSRGGLVDGWMDGWMDGWVGGWMDGWMGGWMGARENGLFGVCCGALLELCVDRQQGVETSN